MYKLNSIISSSRHYLLGLVMLVWAATVCPIVAGADETRIIEDFEAYGSDQVIADSAISAPWRRFGEATQENMMATTDYKVVLNGHVSGRYAAAWPAFFGAVRYVFPEGTDLSSYNQVGVTIISDFPDTKTRAKIAISDGKTTYASIEAQPISNTAKNLLFIFNKANMAHTDGPRVPFEKVVADAIALGLDFVSLESDDQTSYSEIITIDDLTVIDGPLPVATDTAPPTTQPNNPAAEQNVDPLATQTQAKADLPTELPSATTQPSVQSASASTP